MTRLNRTARVHEEPWLRRLQVVGVLTDLRKEIARVRPDYWRLLREMYGTPGRILGAFPLSRTRNQKKLCSRRADKGCAGMGGVQWGHDCFTT